MRGMVPNMKGSSMIIAEGISNEYVAFIPCNGPVAGDVRITRMSPMQLDSEYRELNLPQLFAQSSTLASEIRRIAHDMHNGPVEHRDMARARVEEMERAINAAIKEMQNAYRINGRS